MRPVRLHLDTSDYVAMYLAAPATPHALVRDGLIKMTESGRIEIGLSYHVFFELIQKYEPEYRADRLARARLLKQLCRQSALPYPTDLGKGYGFSTDGLWVPRSELDEIEIETLVQNVMQTLATRPDMNSHERRVLSRRNYFVAWARQNPSKSRRLLADHWPLPFGRSFEHSGDFRKYILGEITREDANKELRYYITDPVAACETWYEAYGRDNPALERRDQIADLLVQMLKEHKKITDDAAAAKQEIKRGLATTGENALSPEERAASMALNREIEAFSLENSSSNDLAKHQVWVEMFGDEVAQIAAQIFYGLYSQNRDIKPSDAIDLIHAMYLPHVDLWRGDKDFSNLIIKNRVNFYERVIPTLSDLPCRIEAEFAKQRES